MIGKECVCQICGRIYNYNRTGYTYTTCNSCTHVDIQIIELSPRVVWAIFCENTGLKEIRQLTIKSRFKK